MSFFRTLFHLSAILTLVLLSGCKQGVTAYGVSTHDLHACATHKAQENGNEVTCWGKNSRPWPTTVQTIQGKKVFTPKQATTDWLNSLISPKSISVIGDAVCVIHYPASKDFGQLSCLSNENNINRGPSNYAEINAANLRKVELFADSSYALGCVIGSKDGKDQVYCWKNNAEPVDISAKYLPGIAHYDAITGVSMGDSQLCLSLAIDSNEAHYCFTSTDDFILSNPRLATDAGSTPVAIKSSASDHNAFCYVNTDKQLQCEGQDVDDNTFRVYDISGINRVVSGPKKSIASANSTNVCAIGDNVFECFRPNNLEPMKFSNGNSRSHAASILDFSISSNFACYISSEKTRNPGVVCEGNNYNVVSEVPDFLRLLDKPPTGIIVGSIQDTWGNPIPNTKVFLSNESTSGGDGAIPLMETTTNSIGQYVFSDAPVNKPLVVHAPYISHQRVAVEGNEIEQIVTFIKPDLPVAHFGAVTGAVQNKNGEPLQGLLVQTSTGESTITDAGGWYFLMLPAYMNIVVSIEGVGEQTVHLGWNDALQQIHTMIRP